MRHLSYITLFAAFAVATLVALAWFAFTRSPGKAYPGYAKNYDDPPQDAKMAWTMDELVDGLGSRDPSARRQAAEHLARMGEEAWPAAVPLVKASGDTEEEVVDWVTEALEGFGAPHADDVDALADLLHHPHSDVVYWAATLLGRLGTDSGPASEELARVVAGRKKSHARQRAAWALGKIGPAAIASKPALEAAAASDDPRLARLAQRALAEVTR